MLEQKLPSAEEVAKSWSGCMAAVASAEAAARQVVATRSEAQAAIRELLGLREQFALDVDVPGEPKPGLRELKLAGLLGLLLRNVGYSQVIDRQLDAEVASARRQVERGAA